MERRSVLMGGLILPLLPQAAFGKDQGLTPMKFVETRGIRLATQSFGKASDPTILLIMGATASMLGWPDEFALALAGAGFHVIRFDHRDTGQSTASPPGAPGYSVEDMADDTLAILDAYGVSKAHLIGMSLGGYIAQMVALIARDRVHSLTLIASEPLGWDGAPLPHMSDEVLAQFGNLGTLDWSDTEAVTGFLVGLERAMTGPRYPFDETRSRARIAEVLARTDSPASMFNHASLGTRDDWTGRYRDINCPVLVIHGEADPVLPIKNGRALATGITGAQIVTLPEVGHELPLETLPTIAARIADHLISAEDQFYQ